MKTSVKKFWFGIVTTGLVSGMTLAVLPQPGCILMAIAMFGLGAIVSYTIKFVEAREENKTFMCLRCAVVKTRQEVEETNRNDISSTYVCRTCRQICSPVDVTRYGDQT